MTAGDDQVRLRHMLDAASYAVSFIENRKREDLLEDAMLTRAGLIAMRRSKEHHGKERHECYAMRFQQSCSGRTKWSWVLTAIAE